MADIEAAIGSTMGGAMGGMGGPMDGGSAAVAAAALLPPQSLPAPSSTPSSQSSVPPQHSSVSPAVGFCVPTPISMASLPVSSTITSHPAIASTNVGSMSGGTVSRADPLAALVAGVGAAAIGAGAIAPIVNNLLGNSGGTTVVNNKLNASNGSSMTVIGNNDSLNTSSKTLPDTDNVDAVATSLALAKITQPHTTPSSTPSVISSSAPVLKVSSPESQTKLETAPKETKLSKEECDDDKASLGSATSSRSTTSGFGKSDTESFGKKTPSPVPEGTESANSQEVGSYASIPDLTSATESMRDSDTDNHSEVHNVTANLSDLDNDVHEQQKTVPVSQYPVGALPVVVEHPTYGWSSMLGLDRAKEALKELFIARSFPPVFDGTEGSCKGILLFGPSGSGKTCLARALAKEANNALFVGISSRFLLTHNPFDAIKLVRCMFDQARHEKPAVILFDEIEALCYHPNNESAIRAKDEILAQVRGLTTLPPAYPPRQDPSTYNEGILVLGTTNQPWLLEDRLRRVFAYNIHDDLATIMTQFRCRYNDDLQQKYSAYISAATHRAEDLEETTKDKKDKPKGVKKFSHRIAKSLAAAVLSVID
ncbi:Vacuolar protein sorting-associated protein 4B [Armadillidium nasatum]|uniref:Vacuolar protein sorting-associated protein 4B n=1 Tax=Armadillidium nasatum TaxID=96803 RepID=A0A5N5SXM4_9CRUS|nr:Vacuolar protein sorting-associated protein 4B [Armadillidium nasatum]